MDYDEFIQWLKKAFSTQVLPSTDQDCFGVFPVTNRGIQIWMFLFLHRDSGSVFQAVLPCRRLGTPKTVNLTMCNSNYYRYPSVSLFPGEISSILSQVSRCVSRYYHF